MDAPVPRSAYGERPDYRVDLLARTNVMTAWLDSARLAVSGGYVAFDQDAVRVALGKGHYTGGSGGRRPPGQAEEGAHDFIA